jgi:hypothetical protein
MTLNELDGETTLSDTTSANDDKFVFPQELRRDIVSGGTSIVVLDDRRTLVAILEISARRRHESERGSKTGVEKAYTRRVVQLAIATRY